MAASDDRPYRVAINIDAAPDPQYVLELAEAFAQIVRALNHVTRHHEALEYPAEADELIRDVALAVSRFPQLLEQAGRWLAAEHEAGRVGTDDDRAPATIVAAARIRLDRAREIAHDLAAALAFATAATSHLKTADSGEDADG